MIFSKVAEGPSFGERAVHSVNHMYPSYYVYFYFSCFPVWFRDGTLVLLAPFSGYCLPLTSPDNVLLLQISMVLLHAQGVCKCHIFCCITAFNQDLFVYRDDSSTN